MSDAHAPDASPYRGLQPFTEKDSDYFFGRDRDREIIISNLYAAPLTVFYGASGVGKSSVLLAGVAPELRKTPRVAVVVFRDWQHEKFEVSLKREVLKAVSASVPYPGARDPRLAVEQEDVLTAIGGGAQAAVDPELELDEFLLSCAREFRGSVFFILDQFEEYFHYHPPSPRAERFDAALARAVNRQEVDANFLLSMRDDGLSGLDRFQKRIPNLLNNLLRLEHLDRVAAAEAIRRPLAKYNELHPREQPPVSIEDELVRTLLDDLPAGNNEAGGGRAAPPAGATFAHAQRIETPLLQMALTRLWQEETEAGSRALRLATLRRLGGAANIVRKHLDDVMDKLDEEEQRVAASLFRFLVTRSGFKIAHAPADLADLAERPVERVAAVLTRLAEPDVRVLRSVAAPPDRPAPTRYEITHDVLAAAIRDWRTRYARAEARREADKKLEEERRAAEKKLEEERREAETKLREESERAEEQAKFARRLRVISLALVGALLLAVGFAVYAMWQKAVANERAREAVEALARARDADVRARESELDKEALKRLFLEYSQTTQGGPRLTEEQLENKIREGRRAAESGDPRAAAPRDLSGIGKLWAPGTTLRIRFLDGTSGQRETVEKYAREWTEYANIKFAFGDDPGAEIRVSFENPGSYSYIGTDALGTPKDRPTMNLGFVAPEFPEREKRRSVLHEFGHVLGLLHEFQNPSANIPWDKEAVYRFGERVSGWDRSTVDANFFGPWRSKDLPPKEFDPLSIMMFAFPAELRTDRVAMGDNDQLSEGDKAYIAKLYPR